MPRLKTDETRPAPSRKIPVLINVDQRDWRAFQELCGRRQVSARIRELVREVLDTNGR